jgi:hypothetical protein
MKEKVEEYAEQLDETQSTATRELIRAGIEQEEAAGTVPVWYVISLIGWMFVAGAFLDVSAPLGLAGAALVVLSGLEERVGLLDRLA